MKQKLAPTQQWHHVHSLKVGRHPSSTLHWHPAMAPPPSPHHSTLQWHPAMAPSNGTTSAPPKLVVPSPHYSTLQWQSGAQQYVRSPKLGRHPPPQPQYATMAPYNGAQQWHHVHCTLQWHPGATSNPPKWFVAPPYWK